MRDTPIPADLYRRDPDPKPRRLRGYRKWEAEAQRQSGTVSVRRAIDTLICHLGYEERLREQTALDVWDRVVGPEIARAAKPHSIKNGILKIKVTNSVWRNELTYIKEDIRSRMNAELERPVVSDIKFS